MLYRVLIVGVLFAALGTASAQQSHNLALLKKDTQILERIVHEILKQNFPDPFALTAEPRGAYLQGYGITLAFQLNINRAKIRTLFGEMTAPKSMGQKTKDQQLRLLKDIMVQCLADYGQTVKQLGPHDRITIQAHVQDRNELDPGKNNAVIVLTALKDDLNLLATRKLTADQFKERVHVLEY
jgi:hypothetical protein